MANLEFEKWKKEREQKIAASAKANRSFDAWLEQQTDNEQAQQVLQQRKAREQAQLKAQAGALKGGSRQGGDGSAGLSLSPAEGVTAHSAEGALGSKRGKVAFGEVEAAQEAAAARRENRLAGLDLQAERQKRQNRDAQLKVLEKNEKLLQDIVDKRRFNNNFDARYEIAQQGLADVQAKKAALLRDWSVMREEELQEAANVQQSRKAAERWTKLSQMDLEGAKNRAEQVSVLEENEQLLQQMVQRAEDFRDFGEKYQLAKQGLAEVQAKLAELRADESTWSDGDIQEAEQIQTLRKWEDVQLQKDFAAKSGYRSTANGEAPRLNANGMYNQTGYDDIFYELVNGTEGVSGMVAQNEGMIGADIAGVSIGFVQQMTQDEVAVYNYYYNTEGPEKAKEYVQALQSNLVARQANARAAYYKSYAQESPVAASVFSTAMTAFKPLSYVGQAADVIAGNKLDQNAGYSWAQQAQSAIRGEVEKTVEKKWGKVGSFLYQTGMSMGDFLVAAAFSGAGSMAPTLILGSGAAADYTVNAMERGLDDKTAFSLGTIAGIAEGLTEKYSLDTLLDKTSVGKNAIGYLLRNVLAEGGEEVASDVVRLFADTLLAKDRSEWQQSIDAYKAIGYTDSEAFAMAMTDQAQALGLDFLGGAISGGVMAGAGVAVNAAGNRVTQKQTQKEWEKAKAQLEAVVNNTDSVNAKEAALNALREQGTITEEQYQIGIDQIEDAIFERGDAAGGEAVQAKHVSTKRLRETAAENGVDRKTEQKYRRLSRATGTQMEFYSSAKQGENGYMDHATGTVFINVQSKKAWEWTLGHELTHTVQGTDGYRQFATLALRNLQENGVDVGAELQKRIDLYGTHGQTLNQQTAAYEVVADWAADNLFTSEQAVRELIRGDRSLGQRILDWITEMIRKLRGEEAEAETEQLRYLRQARNLYARALNERNAQTPRRSAQTRAEKGDAPHQSPAVTASPQGEARDGEQTKKAPKKKSAEKAAQEEAEQRQAARTKELQQAMDQLDAAHAAGEITDEEYDEAYDQITSQPEWQERSFSITDPEEQERVLQAARKLTSGEMSIAEFNRTIGGRRTTQRRTERDDGLSQEARNIKNAARRQNLSVQEYLHQNWELFDVDGEWNAAAREALDSERGSRSYSFGDEDSNEKYSYNTLVSKPDMTITEVDDGQEFTPNSATRNDVVQTALENASQIGRTDEQGVYVKVEDTGREVLLSTNGLRHGLDRRLQENAPATIMAGEILKDSVAVNELRPKRKNATGSYILLGAAKGKKNDLYTIRFIVNQFTNEVEQIDVLYALNTKKEPAALLPVIADESATLTGSTISIAQLLEIARKKFPDVLSQDVLQHFGMQRPNTEVANSVSYSFEDDAESAQEPAEGKRVAVTRETLTAKAAGKLRGIEREMANEIRGNLAVPKLVPWNDAGEIVKKATDALLATGEVKRDAINDAVHEAMQSRITAVRAFLEKYEKVEHYLQNISFTLEEAYRKELGDWDKFFEKAKKSLPYFQNENGLPIAKAFSELWEMAPELFTEYITRPPQQLKRMMDIANDLQQARALADETAALTPKELAKQETEIAKEVRKTVNRHKKDLYIVRAYAEDRAERVTEDIQVPETEEEAAPLFERRRAAQRELQKVRNKNLLTADDEAQVSEMLKGKRTARTIAKGSNREGILAVYKAEKEYRSVCRILEAYKNRRKQADNAEADELLATADTWKDKQRLGAMAETQERNIEDIVPDKKLAQRIIDTYFAPVHEHEAERLRFVNEYVARVAKLGLGQKPEKGNENSESYAVQFAGEAEYIIKELEQSRFLGEMYGKTLQEWQTELDTFWGKNPNMDRARIDNAIREFHKIYDELLPMMNEVRVRNGYEPVPYRKGYFPHFSKKEQDGIISAFMKSMGIKSSETVELPTSINGLTYAFKPRIRWFAHAQERTGNKTDFDALEGFERYLNVISDVIYHTDDIRKLRTFAARMRYRTTDEGIRTRDDQIRQNPTMSDEDKEEMLNRLYDKEAKYTLKNYVVDLDDYINQLAGKKSDIDRFLERIMGRQIFAVGDAIDRSLGANIVGGSIRSALSNLVALPQGAAELKTRHFINGMADTMRAYREDDGFVYQSTFLTNRRGMDKIVETMTQKASNKVNVFFKIVDEFVADTLVRARVRQNMEEGLTYSQAMREADAWGARVLGDRSKGAMPTLFGARNPIARVITKFQLEVNNTPRHLFKDIIGQHGEKGKAWVAAVILKYCIGAWLMDEILEALLGDRIGLDPLNMANELVGDLTGYELPNLFDAMGQLISTGKVDFSTEKGDAVKNLANNVLDQTPFTGVLSMTNIDEELGLDFDGGRIPLESALPDIGGLISTWGNENNSMKKKLRETLDEAQKPIFYLAMPFGGGQLKRILQGLEVAHRGGKFTLDAEGNPKLQYPMYNDTLGETVLNSVQSMLLGPTSTSAGQEWIESGFNTLSADETQAYLDMQNEGVGSHEAYELLQQLRSAEKTGEMTKAAVKRQILRESKISDEGKAMVYKHMMTSDKENELIEKLSETNQDIGSIAKMLMTVKDAENSNAKRDAILAANLTDKERQTAYRYIFGTEQEDGSYASSRDDDIAAFRNAGLKMQDFLEVQNEYTRINEQYQKSSEKATEFSRWVNQHYATGEREVVKECFKYFSQIPANSGNYDKLMNAGLSDQKAYDLAEVLAALEPEDGNKSVTDRQRFYAIAKEGLSDKETMAAMEVVAGEGEMAKIRAGYELDLSPKLYATIKYELREYDADGNGSFTHEEVKAAIDAYKKRHPDLSFGTDAILWQMLTGSTSAKSNPYNRRVGETYLKYLAEEKQQAK